jgi:hypothetical protein
MGHIEKPNGPPAQYKTGKDNATHRAWVFKRTAMRKGRVVGDWDTGGYGIQQDNGDFTAFVDMIPRAGWDGRIRFIKEGNDPPNYQPAPVREMPEDEEPDEI